MSKIYGHGVDLVAPITDYPALRAAGFTFAFRYAVPAIPGKMVQLREIAAAHHAGVDIMFVYETSGQTWMGGVDQGLRDGQAANAALRSLGAPYTAACYHAVDSQAMPSSQLQVMSWLDGVIRGMRPYRTGVYGEYDVVEWAYRLYPEAFRWQTKAWSGGKVSLNADILQLGTIRVGSETADMDVSYNSHVGQWYADPVKTPPHPLGDLMLQGEIAPAGKVGTPVPTGSAMKVILYADTGLYGDQAQKVRVAIWSGTRRYDQIEEVTIASADPVTVTFMEHDVAAVSFARNPDDGDAPVSYIIY